jgi:MbtH protein
MLQNAQDQYVVVVNSEEQYSILSLAREVPEGWQLAGFDGPMESCVDYVDQHWRDMRPRSLREAMDHQPA